MSGQRWIVRTTVTLFLATAAAVWFSTASTLGGFTAATVQNANSARVATLSISNSLGGSTCTATESGATAPNTCTGSLYPATATSTAGAGPTNGITNTGTVLSSALTAKYRVPGCGPLALANSVTNGTSGALLPRGGFTLNPSTGPVANGGSITLDGAVGSYAASTLATTEPTVGGVGLGGGTLGLGIWFRTSSPTAEPLFSFSASPLADATAASDRTLYLDANGRIGFVASTSLSTTPATAAGVTRYNDGAWHFGYVSLADAVLGYTVTVSVDGRVVATQRSGVFGSLSTYSGYWHAGWSPAHGYFTGSLAGFVVDDSGNAPTTPATPTGYAFDRTATQLWTMSDPGGTFDGTTVGGIYTGAYPTGVPNPCQAVTATWTLGNPAATVAPAGTPLATLSTAVTAATDPDPGTTQTSVITLTHASSINSYLVGLTVYAPVVSTYSSGSNWQVAFAWSQPASTFVIKA